MIVFGGKCKIYLPWSRSLKDKRAVRRRLQSRLQQVFHISIQEEKEYAELTQTLVLNFAYVTHSISEGNALGEKIYDAICSLTEGEIQDYFVQQMHF